MSDRLTTEPCTYEMAARACCFARSRDHIGALQGRGSRPTDEACVRSCFSHYVLALREMMLAGRVLDDDQLSHLSLGMPIDRVPHDPKFIMPRAVLQFALMLATGDMSPETKREALTVWAMSMSVDVIEPTCEDDVHALAHAFACFTQTPAARDLDEALGVERKDQDDGVTDILARIARTDVNDSPAVGRLLDQGASVIDAVRARLDAEHRAMEDDDVDA